MDSLPDEILVRIFKSLPLSSRNQVRLVNKNWNQACNDKSIIKKEVLFIEPLLSVSHQYFCDVFSTLAETRRSIINIDILGIVDVYLVCDADLNNFWRCHGTKIRYLALEKLTGKNSRHLIEFLSLCPNVKELNFPNLFQEDGMWEKLSTVGIALKEVTCLTLDIKFDSFKNSCINEALPKLFPNVRELNISFSPSYHLYEDDDYSKCIIGKEICRIMDAVLTLSAKLKCLELHIPAKEEEFILILRPTEEERIRQTLTNIIAAVEQIKTLKIAVNGFSIYQNINQMKNLKNLTTLHFYRNTTSYSTCDLLIEILDHLPNLRHLLVRTDNILESDNKRFFLEKLVSSSLKSLVIRGSQHNWSVPENNDLYNKTLEVMDIDVYYTAVDSRAVSLFLIEHFSNLQTLSINFKTTTRKELQSMFIHQKNLKSLSLKFRSSMDLYGAVKYCPECAGCEDGPQRSYTFNEFAYLQHLKFTLKIDSRKRFPFSGLVLPHLKYLYVTLEKANRYESKEIESYTLLAFFRAVEEMPCLEFLKLHYWMTVPYKLVLRQCECHKNLQYLCFQGDYSCKISDDLSEHESFFRVSESLQYVKYKQKSLCKNVITKETQDYNHCGYGRKFQHKKIGDEPIKWIKNENYDRCKFLNRKFKNCSKKG